MKKISDISFLEIESIPLLVKDFLMQKIPDFGDKNFNPENIEKQMNLKADSFSAEKREILCEVFNEQYSGFHLSEKQKTNIELLKKENTFTVTTGHQLNLFTGPVFFIYKILQTIKLAEFLNEKYPEKKTVPVFWLASEDHDFEEINHFSTAENFYETKAESGGAAGKIVVTDDFFVSEFEKEFKDSVFGTELILLMKKAYKKGNTLSEAAKILVHELFSEYGLLVIDGDDVKLKNQMKPIFQDELLQKNLFEKTKEKVKFLSENYGKVQVNPREINLFYLSETRNRIEYDGERFLIVDKNITFSKDEILTELENHPERFSPNALMRPVFQETVLPNISYIGGNAEIMYWLELPDYFRYLELPFPVLIPRNSLLFVTEKTLIKTKSLGLEINDFFRNFASLTKELLLENNEILSVLNKEEILLKNGFDELSSKAELTDKTFGNLVKAEQIRQLKSFERMRKRLLRAEKIKQKEKLERLEKLFLAVHPRKIWQERVYNFSVFYADFGIEWLDKCYEMIDVEKSGLIIVRI